MKKPEEFPYEKWVLIAQENVEQKVVIPPHWMTREQFSEKFGYGSAQTARIAKQLLDKHLLIRHMLKRTVYYEPVIPESESYK